MNYRQLALVILVLAALCSSAPAATTIYAATHVGLYQSTDSGVTWQQVSVTVSNGLLQGTTNVSALAIDPLDSNKIYFIGSVTGTSAFFKSTDGGKTWSATLVTGMTSGTNDRSSYWVCIDPVVTSTIYISTNKTFRSTDAGATWVEMSSLSTLAGLTGTNGLATDPNTSGVMYASGSAGGISKSTDFGVTWTNTRFTSQGSPTIGAPYVNPRNSAQVIVTRTSGQGCSDAKTRLPVNCSMFMTLDGGQTWNPVNVPGSSRGVAYDPNTGDIYAGANQTGVGSVVLKSSDQGKTWTPMVKLAGGINDGPQVSVDPAAPGNVYSLGDTSGGGGLFMKSSDGGVTWKKLTMPRFCPPGNSGCPNGLFTVEPQVYQLAYPAPPPPPRVAVAQTVSAASGQPGPVAPESIVVATGSHIATDSGTGDLDQPPMVLAGTTINVTDSAGVTRPAVMFRISQTQVTYQIPPGTAPGTATVTITAGDGVTGSVQVQIAPVAPGVYTVNSSSLAKAYVLRVTNGNQIIEDVFDIDATGAVIARPITISNGDQVYLIAYGTGFRAAGGDIGVTVGGESAPIQYAGPQGVQPGLDQFNILIPPDLGTGTPQSVQIVLTAGGQTANTVNVTVQ